MSARIRFEIFPADLDLTARFYTELLGFDIVRDERTEVEPYLALERDGIQLGASLAPPVAGSRELRRPPIGVEMVLEVDDLDREHARIANSVGRPRRS